MSQGVKYTGLLILKKKNERIKKLLNYWLTQNISTATIKYS